MEAKPKKRRRGTALMNVARAAELLGVAYNTISKAIADGELDCIDVETKGGNLTPAITYAALRRYRDNVAAKLRERGVGLRFVEKLERKEF